MNTIEEKLNLPKITNITDEEWNIIYQNIELRTLFLQRVKEGASLDFYNMPEELIRLLLTPEYFIYVLNSLKKDEPDDYLRYFCGEFNDEARQTFEAELGSGLYEFLVDYYNKNKQEILNLFLEHIEKVYEIANPDMIQIIIEKNLIQCIHIIKVENPSTELEDFIIKNIEEIEVPLKTYSKRIEDACIAAGKPALLSSFYKKSKRLEEELLKALNDNKINIDQLDYTFREEHKNNIAIIKDTLSKGRYYDFDPKLLKEYPELIGFIIELIKKNKISQYILSDCTEYPEIVSAVIEHLYSGKDLIFLLKYDWDKIAPSFNKHPDLIVSAIEKAYEKDVSIAYELFSIISYQNDHKIFDSLIKRIISTFTFDEIIKIYNSQYNETMKDLLSEYEDYISFETDSIPEDFDLSKTYSPKILLKIIPKLNFEQLDKNKLSEAYYATPELAEAIIVRLAELKSNKFNSASYIFSGKLTPRMIEIILRDDNPLNLTAAQKIRFLPNDIGTLKPEYLLQILKTHTHLSLDDFNTMMNILFVTTYDENSNTFIIDFNEEKIKILTTILNSDIELDTRVYRTIKEKLKNMESFPEQKEKVQELFRTFLLKNKEVPLELTLYFDEEVRTHSTYDSSTLSTNPELYDIESSEYYIKYPKDYIEFVLNAIKDNKPIDLTILYKVVNETNNLELLNYENVTYNHKNTFDTVYSIIRNTSNDKNYEKCIIRWINNTDISELVKSQQSRIINEIFKNENIFKIYIEKANNINIDYNGLLLNYLFYNYSEEFKPIARQFIIKQMKNRKIYKSEITLSKQLLELNIPELDEYLINEHFQNNTTFNWLSDPTLYELVKNKPQYYEAFIKNITINPQIFNNYLNVIHNYPDLIKLYIDALVSEQISVSRFNICRLHFNLDVMKTVLKLNPSFIKEYITRIIHDNNLVNYVTDETFNYMLKQITIEYNINAESLLELKKLYGCNTLCLLENENILNLLRQDPETVKKFVEIFKVRELDRITLEAVNDSLQQNIYTIENPEEINIYTNLLERIQQGITEEDINNFINTVCKKDSNGKYIYMLETLETEDQELNELYKTNKEEFIRELIKKIQINQNIYAPILNIITSNYLAERRNEVTRGEDIFIDTEVKFRYDERQLHDAYFKYLKDNEPYRILRALRNGYDHGFDGDYELDKLTIMYLTNPQIEIDKDKLIQVKKNIKSIKERLKELLYPYMSPSDIDDSYLVNVKRILEFDTRTPNISDVSKVNFDIILKLISDKEKYDCLIRLLDKYKILEWSNLFDASINKLTLGEGTPELYNFINAFSTIYDNEVKILKRKRKELMDETIAKMKKNGSTQEEIDKYIQYKENEPIIVNVNAFKILKYSSIYSAIANGYKIVLGLEDYDLIKRNDEPNSAYRGTMMERLDYDADLMIKMIQMDEVTIPSFVKEHKPEDKEKRPLRAIVGCKADSRNLTQGERTGACMRAYGHAHDLFTFTNTDSRGFHITFEDPTDGKYISRVSGFRNGNTVFLNQLRDSKDFTRYSNEDVVEACKDIARELIERSKDSDMPIENVVCSPCYALTGYTTQTLSRYDIGDGVYTGYKDVNQNAVVLATTGENGMAVPLKLNSTSQPIYKTCRLPLKHFETPNIGNEVKILMQRIDVLRTSIETQDSEYYKSVDYDFEILENEFVYAIIGQDFYVALDVNGNIRHNIAVKNEDAIKEYEEVLETIEQYKMNRSGGHTNGKQL